MTHSRNEFPVYSRDQGLTQKIEYTGSNATYIGRALPSTAVSASGWQISKLTYDGNDNMTDLQWASGSDNFDKVWNDRATYSYS